MGQSERYMILEFVRFWKVRSRMRFRLLENEGQNRHVSSGIRLFFVRMKGDLNRALRAINGGNNKDEYWFSCVRKSLLWCYNARKKTRFSGFLVGVYSWFFECIQTWQMIQQVVVNVLRGVVIIWVALSTVFIWSTWLMHFDVFSSKMHDLGFFSW